MLCLEVAAVFFCIAAICDQLFFHREKGRCIEIQHKSIRIGLA